MSSKASKVIKNIVSESQELQAEPLPNSNEDVAEIKAEFASYDEVTKRIKEIDSEVISLMREKVRLQKEADRFYSKTAKEAKSKNKKKNTDANRKLTGFGIKVLIPDKFFKFIKYGLTNNLFTQDKTTFVNTLNLHSDSLVNRTFFTGVVYDYINNLNLHPGNDRRIIKPDEHIKELFTMTDTEVEAYINFQNFQTYTSRLFPKKQMENKNNVDEVDDNKIVDDEEEDDEEDDEEEEEVVEVVEVVPVKSKSNKFKNASSI